MSKPRYSHLVSIVFNLPSDHEFVQNATPDEIINALETHLSSLRTNRNSGYFSANLHDLGDTYDTSKFKD